VATKRREPRWLSVEAVRVLHAEQIAVFGGEAGLLNPGSLEAALARPQNAFVSGGTTDIAGLAAIYLVGLVRAHAFVDGNQRVGLAAALVFLAKSGQPLHVPPVDLYDLTMRVAVGRSREAWVTTWLRKRLGPSRR
jgi:death on curing protein